MACERWSAAKMMEREEDGRLPPSKHMDIIHIEVDSASLSALPLSRPLGTV